MMFKYFAWLYFENLLCKLALLRIKQRNEVLEIIRDPNVLRVWREYKASGAKF